MRRTVFLVLATACTRSPEAVTPPAEVPAVAEAASPMTRAEPEPVPPSPVTGSPECPPDAWKHEKLLFCLRLPAGFEVATVSDTHAEFHGPVADLVLRVDASAPDLYESMAAADPFAESTARIVEVADHGPGWRFVRYKSREEANELGKGYRPDKKHRWSSVIVRGERSTLTCGVTGWEDTPDEVLDACRTLAEPMR